MTAPLSPSDLAEIEAVAKAAHIEGVPWHGLGSVMLSDADLTDAAPIARMDPATTLALLAWGKRAEDAVARVRELLDPPSTKSDDGCVNCGDRRLQHVGQVDGGECRLCGFCGGFKPRLPDVSRARILAALDADAAAGGAG